MFKQALKIGKKKIIHISTIVFISILGGFLSSIAIQSSITTWHTTLKKPIFTPSNWIFAPVWIVLYMMMGVAGGVIWNKGFYYKWIKIALCHFGGQLLLLNAAWSIFFLWNA